MGPNMVTHAGDPSKLKAETGGSWFPGQPQLANKFQASLAHPVRSCGKQNKKKRLMVYLKIQINQRFAFKIKFSNCLSHV